MRRALRGIVPEEILHRKRKAFVARSPLTIISSEMSSLWEMSGRMTSAALGLVDAQRFCEALEAARSGRDVPIVTLMRTVNLEMWLSMMMDRGLLRLSSATNRGLVSGFAKRAQAAVPNKASAS
jgi:asparagine synthase (glutamine-hydrolysing)